MSALTHLYRELDFENGPLIQAVSEPVASVSAEDWLEKGEWLAAARRAGAERLFFVDNNPVAVFAECGPDYTDKVSAFNRAWSLARPRLLFLSSPGEILVLDLAQEPLRVIDGAERPSLGGQLRTLAVIDNIEDVASQLQQFHRDNIESGRVFGDSRFGDLKNRADKALIRDLKTVRGELIDAGLSGGLVKYAHALIGRSIFIRYLEDRGILTEDYFLAVADTNTEWLELLRDCASRPDLNVSSHEAFYPRLLRSKAFTYALFRALARDFNGDMFPDVDEEELVIQESHLGLIRDLLYGNAGAQQQLFFYSYNFNVIPLDLISSIYEEFYHSSVHEERERKRRARQDGIYYTPSALVEFVVSRTLTIDQLRKRCRVLDPACGSGIFLVEAFRRIVRYQWHTRQERPSYERLTETLRDQIAGIEINMEAARIAAFSLYLAMLHYLEPPSILAQIKQGRKLPYLLVSDSDSGNHYHSIWIGNAFDSKAIASNPLVMSRFGQRCADVVVGNPPWGSTGGKADAIAKAREKVMLDWCRKYNRPIGDKESSQAFLWKALDFLKENGQAGMLVSAGVLFKHSKTTQQFRREWMNNVCLKEVFNFAHVRSFFFAKSVSPFLAINFAKAKQGAYQVHYYSAKNLMISREIQAVLLSKYDIHTFREEDLASGHLWKTYSFGRPADNKLIKHIQSRPELMKYADCDKSGRGYETASQTIKADKLKGWQALVRLTSRYDPLHLTFPPDYVYRLGTLGAYDGFRVIVNEGISENSEPQGMILAQYADTPFCFYRSIYGIKLSEQEAWCHKALLGVLWSSLARYYFFMTSANWGLWHHKLLLDEVMTLPVVFDKKNPVIGRVISIVDELRGYHPEHSSLLRIEDTPGTEIDTRRQDLETRLDESVFDLYELSEEQRDLVRDCCSVTLPFFYKPTQSGAGTPAISENDVSWLSRYAMTFGRRWNPYLGNGEEMRVAIHIGGHRNLVAVEFFPADKDDAWDFSVEDNSWGHILEQVSKALPQPMSTSQIVLDGVVHLVTDEAIIIIKRNEKRFWTKSIAREDADATLCKRMVEPESGDGARD